MRILVCGRRSGKERASRHGNLQGLNGKTSPLMGPGPIRACRPLRGGLLPPVRFFFHLDKQ